VVDVDDHRLGSLLVKVGGLGVTLTPIPSANQPYSLLHR
jgi:hypothetical protein